MSIPQAKVHHWRYENGMVAVPPLLRLTNTVDPEFCPEVVGWHCWVYTNDNHDFLSWMEQHCPTAECIPRFNSGDPMITVHIVDQEEAAYFRLNFQT
jgi:hypothetical protein